MYHNLIDKWEKKNHVKYRENLELIDKEETILRRNNKQTYKRKKLKDKHTRKYRDMAEKMKKEIRGKEDIRIIIFSYFPLF